MLEMVGYTVGARIALVMPPEETVSKMSRHKRGNYD